jgi:glyoxylase-like metal-dependent hydrolase (beta-lactamase superfamily II)
LGYAQPSFVTQPLRDGQMLEFADRGLRVISRPGHSPSDTLFYDEERRSLFGADHLLDGSTTAILTPPLNGAAITGRPRAFAEYLASIRATAAMDLELLLPGHGPPVRDPKALIQKRMHHFEQMTEQIRSAVSADPRRAMEIAAMVRDPIPDRAIYFVLCDTLGYLDGLIDEGTVIETEDSLGVSRFATSA